MKILENRRQSLETFGKLRKQLKSVFQCFVNSSEIFGNFPDVIGNVRNGSQELKSFGAGFLEVLKWTLMYVPFQDYLAADALKDNSFRVSDIKRQFIQFFLNEPYSAWAFLEFLGLGGGGGVGRGLQKPPPPPPPP